MKKRNLYLAALLSLLLLSACGGKTDAPSEERTWPLTMREIIDANQTDVLVERYGSVLLESQYESGYDITGLVTTAYADGEVFYDQSLEYQQLFASDGAYFYTDGMFGPPLSAEEPDLSGFDYISLDPDLTAAETITSVTADSNGGTLTVTTELSAEKLAALYAADAGVYTPGDYTAEEYVLNAGDYAILSDTTTLYHGDGSFEVIGTVRAVYGVDRPENAEILLEHLRAEDRRTVTIVLDPGTAEEQALTVEAMRGDPVFPYLPFGYDLLYTDEACTEVFDGSADLTTDLTLYSAYVNPYVYGQPVDGEP